MLSFYDTQKFKALKANERTASLLIDKIYLSSYFHYKGGTVVDSAYDFKLLSCNLIKKVIFSIVIVAIVLLFFVLYILLFRHVCLLIKNFSL